MFLNNIIDIQDEWFYAQEHSSNIYLKSTIFATNKELHNYKVTLIDFIKLIVSGHPVVVKGAISLQEANKLCGFAKQLENISDMKSSRQRVSVDTLDHHCRVDESSAGFEVKATKHVYNFFRRPNDFSAAFSVVEQLWEQLKVLSGVPAYPHPNYIDRLQVVHYPSGGGCLDWHRDAADHQHFVIGIILSERSENYMSGGLCFRTPNGGSELVDQCLSIGDLVLFDPRLEHRVKHIDAGSDLDWNQDRGRWFAGMYSMPFLSSENPHSSKLKDDC